jgi:glycogen debranching enzyme
MAVWSNLLDGRGRRIMFAATLSSASGIDLDDLSQTLCELARVPRLELLGASGPLMASAGADSLYACLFGRDSLRMALDLLDDFPAVARATLVELARLQGVRHHVRSEEEPGRILHEHRFPDDPRAAQLRQDWDFPYYGAVDATPQWINLLVAYCNRVNSVDLLEAPITDRSWRHVTLLDSLIAAVDWMLSRLDDPSGGGYVWVRRMSPRGIANQVWEDSGDAYYHADGRLFDVTRPYAPVAVQGIAHDALLSAADLLDRSPVLGLPVDTASLRQRAAALRARTIANFWQPDLGTFAHAVTLEEDGSQRPARVVASSPGHLLSSRMLDGDEAVPLRAQLAARLMQPDLLAAAGVRTRSTTAPRFRPGAYHNGSTWPWDTGVIADGLRRHGFVEQADDLETRVVTACARVGGFPEFFRGDDGPSVSVNVRTVDAIVDGVLNRLEQPPQARQGWTATRVWRILRSAALRGV